MSLILGIDQGSTHTRAAICDEQGNIMGIGYADGASHTYDGIQTAMQRVRKAFEAAREKAGIDSDVSLSLFAGMSGADWPDEPPMLASHLGQLGKFSSIHVVNDAIIALRAGTDKPFGAILIGGTGANCAIRSPGGKEYVFGFYHDPVLMGAHAISHQALYKIFQVHAYQEKATLLTQLFLAALHYENIDQLCRNFYEQKISNVHLLAPLVFEADQQGDEAAGEILSQYGKGSAGLLFAGLHRFQMTEMELEVVVSGSVFKARNSSLVKALTTELGRLVPQAKIVNAKYEPVIGALLLALEALGIKVDDPVLRNIERSAKQLNLLREG